MATVKEFIVNRKWHHAYDEIENSKLAIEPCNDIFGKDTDKRFCDASLFRVTKINSFYALLQKTTIRADGRPVQKCWMIFRIIWMGRNFLNS